MKPNFILFFRRHSNLFAKFALVMLLVAFAFPPLVEASGSLTNVKDTLTNDRPSVATAITVGVSANDTSVTVASTLGIAQGDTITFCGAQASCGTTENRIVSSVNSLTQLSLTVGTTNPYTTSGYVYLKTTSRHTVTFTTRSTVNAGSFVLTIAGSSSANTTTPASTGFVFNGISTTTDISVSGFTAATTATSTASNNLIFTFTYTGSLASNTAVTLTVGNTANLLNPTKVAGSGTADTFSFQVDQKDNGNNVIDTTSGKVGTIEAVGVSATVAPSLTFSINAVTAATSVTAHATSFSTTATSVPFGTLNVNASSTGAQYIHIDTNSNSGYAVTVQQDGSLRKSNGTTIVDFSSAAAAENDGTVGFGYALHNKSSTSGLTLPFNYNDSSRKFNSIGFSSTSPVTMMSNTGPASGDEVYVDYYLKVNAAQAQGTYQNLITYIATAIY
jgi:hypothetical protein